MLYALSIFSLIVVGALYTRGLRRCRVKRWSVLAFWAGMFALVAALISPLENLSKALFSAHMIQHLLIILVAAPLLVLSKPVAPLLWGLPQGGRRLFTRVERKKALRALWRALTQPLAVWGIHMAVIWLWHLPTLYESALYNDTIHVLEHASFFLTALLYWWAVLQPQHYGVHVLSVFGMAMGSAALGALITFTRVPWYPAHTPYTAAWGLTPLEDQRLAGLIMWIPAGVVYVIAAAALFLLWMQTIEQRMERLKGSTDA
jgi:putative membrane protein